MSNRNFAKTKERQVQRILTIIFSFASLSRMSCPKKAFYREHATWTRICASVAGTVIAAASWIGVRRRTHVYGELHVNLTRSLIPRVVQRTRETRIGSTPGPEMRNIH